jgi:hypothetical protein
LEQSGQTRVICLGVGWLQLDTCASKSRLNLSRTVEWFLHWMIEKKLECIQSYPVTLDDMHAVEVLDSGSVIAGPSCRAIGCGCKDVAQSSQPTATLDWPSDDLRENWLKVAG